MKKQYIVPHMEVVKTGSIQLLSGSDMKLGGGTTNIQFSREELWEDEDFL